MNKNALKIYFCYPGVRAKDRAEILDDIIGKIPEDSNSGYASFTKKSFLKNHLDRQFGDEISTGIENITRQEQSRIKKIIRLTIKRCFDKSAIPPLPVHVFIFPWLGTQYEHKLKGVNGFTVYLGTMHLYISDDKFSVKELKATIVHELNHVIAYHHHNTIATERTLLESMVLEGMADVFRESIIGGEVSAWSSALNEQECHNYLESLKYSLDSKDYRLYNEVFFGAEGKYKKWTGYALGYRIFKSFFTANHGLSWPEIMRMKPKDIFLRSPFAKKPQILSTARDQRYQ